MKEIITKKILTEDASFQLVRTNPKLTGNVKLVINEAGGIWLESIKANPELSKDVYSKVPIDPLQSHAANIFRFFNSGQTPNEIIFDLSEKVDSTKTSKDFKDQYDFSHYFSGAKYLASNKYSERLSYFAPLYIKNELPSYFIVFKIKDPSNAKLDQIKSNYDNGQTKTDYLIELFKKASIIKTFDLREDTPIGKYLTDYKNNPNFPTSPLTVGFGENDYTTWNGIIINEGKLGYRGELLNSLYESSQPLKSFEENITNGYSRNGIIFPNIINFEFAFNDDSSEKYDFNRYLGVYVNAIELTKLDIDLDRAYLERPIWENSPKFKKKYVETDDVYVAQTNPNGVKIPYKNSTINLSEFNRSFTSSDNLFINYITDKDGKLYMPLLDRSNGRSPFEIDYSNPENITLSSSGTLVTAQFNSHGYSTDDLIIINSTDSEYSGEFLITKIDDNQFSYTVDVAPTNSTAIGSSKKEIGSGYIRFANTKIDLGLFFGQSRSTFLQSHGFVSSLAGHSHALIEFNKSPNNYDEVLVYHPHGTRSNANGKYDLIQLASGYALIPNPGDYYIYNDYDNVLGYDEFYANSTGDLSDVARTLAACINGIRTRAFSAYAYNEKVFIKLNAAGDYDAQYKLEFNSTSSDFSIVNINGFTANDLIGTQFNFNGGSKEKNNRLIIDSGHLDKLNQNFESILIKSSDSYSKISKISQYIDEIDEMNSATPSSRSSAIASYLNKIAIVLAEPEKPTVTNNEFLMKSKFRPSVGLLSLFSIKDLDFDFYSSTYTNYPELDLYNYYYVPSNTKILEPGYYYEVKNGKILVDSIEYDSSLTPTFTVSSTTKYSIVSGDPYVVYSNNSNLDLTVPITDKNGEIENFSGFALLKDPSKVSQNVSDPRIKYTNGLSQTEYDFYKENESLDFSLRSKIIPYITKWGIKNGTDSRSNPYRLNVELAFGRNNFSPDHVDFSQNPTNFTHEWYYIESSFNYINDDSIIAKNNYYFEESLDYTKLLTDPDYFINYFTYTPTNSQGIEVGDTQFRYSTLVKNSAGEYDAFFKGFKVTFKDVIDQKVLGPDGKPQANPNTTRFDGYRFTCLLKPIQEDINDVNQAPIKYRVIEHTDYKFIIVVIELAIGSISDLDPYWKTGSPSPLTTLNFADVSGYFTPVDASLTYPYQTVNGDYRVKFNNNISNLTHTLLYSLKHKKYNTNLNSFSVSKFGSKLNISSAGVSSSAKTVNRTSGSNTPEYPSTFSDEFNKIGQDKIVFFKDTLIGKDIFITSKNSLNVPNVPGQGMSKLLSIFDLVTERFVRYDNSTFNSCLVEPDHPTYSVVGSIPYSSGPIINKYYSFKLLNGGENYFEKLFQKLSFARFKQYINTQTFNSIIKPIEYESYSGNTPTKNKDPKFYLEILDVSSIEKINQVITLETSQIPNQFSGQKNIGVDYEVAELTNTFEINRYKGEYEPLAQNCSIYNSKFVFTKNNIKEISLANILFNSIIDDSLTIKNFSHIKVSDTQILELESDDSYLPTYPKINEIAIGQSQYFLLKGNWDWGFHYKYLDKSTKLPVSGALRVEEDDSFLAKLLILPEYIELESFNKADESQFTIIGETQDLDKIDLSNKEIVIKETPTSLTGIINLNNTITRFLMSDGIMTKFNDYLVSTNEYIGNFNTISDYVKEYIKLNILKLYDLDINEFYSKQQASVSGSSTQANSNPNGIDFEFLTDKERFTKGYTQLKSLQINKKERLVLKFSFTKQPGTGLLISPKIKIKFI